MTCVLAGLSRNLLARIQELMSLTHAVNLSIAMAVSLMATLIIINLTIISVSCCAATCSRAEVYKIYSSGPSTDPCGTPNSYVLIVDD